MSDAIGNAPDGAEAMVRMLALHGVKHVFGLCGDISCRFTTHSIGSTMASSTSGPATSGAPPIWRTVMRGFPAGSGFAKAASGGGATYLLPGLAEANDVIQRHQVPPSTIGISAAYRADRRPNTR